MKRVTKRNLRSMACVIFVKKFLEEPHLFDGCFHKGRYRKEDRIEFTFTLSMCPADSFWIVEHTEKMDNVLRDARKFVDKYFKDYKDWWK